MNIDDDDLELPDVDDGDGNSSQWELKDKTKESGVPLQADDFMEDAFAGAYEVPEIPE